MAFQVRSLTLPLSGWVLQTRVPGDGPPAWRLLQPGVDPALPELELDWWEPCGELLTHVRFRARPPHPDAGRWWLLAGDAGEEPAQVEVHTLDGAVGRSEVMVSMGGAWAAEWSGPPAVCQVRCGERTATAGFTRPDPNLLPPSSGTGWYRPGRS